MFSAERGVPVAREDDEASRCVGSDLGLLVFQETAALMLFGIETKHGRTKLN